MGGPPHFRLPHCKDLPPCIPAKLRHAGEVGQVGQVGQYAKGLMTCRRAGCEALKPSVDVGLGALRLQRYAAKGLGV